MTFRSLAAAFAAFFVLSSQATAVTVEHAVMSGSVDAGILIFAIGAVLLVVPKLAKLGVLYMLLADALFVGRILFFPQMQQWLNEHGYAEILAAYDDAGLQKAGCVAICCTLIGIAVVAVLMYWLWRKFWHRFGFYKTRAEIAAAKNKAKDSAESKSTESKAGESEDERSEDDTVRSPSLSFSGQDDAMQSDGTMQALDADAVEAAINKNFGRAAETQNLQTMSESSDDGARVPKTIEEQMQETENRSDSENIAKNAVQTDLSIDGTGDESPNGAHRENLDDAEPSFGQIQKTDSFEDEGPGIGDLGKGKA